MPNFAARPLILSLEVAARILKGSDDHAGGQTGVVWLPEPEHHHNAGGLAQTLDVPSSAGENRCGLCRFESRFAGGSTMGLSCRYRATS